jgi:hypothetical protein
MFERPIRVNAKRWLAEFLCWVLGLMVLDNGGFVIVLTTTFLALEILLLFLPEEILLRRFWIPVVLFGAVSIVLTIFPVNFR